MCNETERVLICIGNVLVLFQAHWHIGLIIIYLNVEHLNVVEKYATVKTIIAFSANHRPEWDYGTTYRVVGK